MTSGETDRDAQVIACDPRVLSPRERALHLTVSVKLLVRQRLRLLELSDGFELHFASAPGLLVELAQWIERESACCPWIEFGLGRSADGVVRLKLTSQADGAKELLAAGLDAVVALAQGATIPPEFDAPSRSLEADDFRQIAAGRDSTCACGAGAESGTAARDTALPFRPR